MVVHMHELFWYTYIVHVHVGAQTKAERVAAVFSTDLC